MLPSCLPRCYWASSLGHLLDPYRIQIYSKLRNTPTPWGPSRCMYTVGNRYTSNIVHASMEQSYMVCLYSATASVDWYMFWCTCTTVPFHPSSMILFPGLGFSLPLLHSGTFARVFLYLFSVPLLDDFMWTHAITGSDRLPCEVGPNVIKNRK